MTSWRSHHIVPGSQSQAGSATVENSKREDDSWSWSDDIYETSFNYSVDEVNTKREEDDEEDLPVGLAPVHDSNFEAGDLLWVKFKTLFWPALVLKVQKIRKLKYVSFIFIEYKEDGQLKYARPERKRVNHSTMFLITREYSTLKALGLSSNLSQSFSRAMEKVDQYSSTFLLTRNSGRLGFACRYFGWSLENAKASDTSASEVKKDVELPSKRITRSSSAKIEPSVYSDDVRAIIAERINRLDAISSYILTKACLNRLLRIYRGQIKSRFKSEYELKRKTASGQFELRSLGFGPLSESQRHTEQVIEAIKQHIFCEPQSSSENVVYIIRVLLPEAVVHAIQHVDKLSREDAEKQFVEGVKWTDEELRFKLT